MWLCRVLQVLVILSFTWGVFVPAPLRGAAQDCKTDMTKKIILFFFFFHLKTHLESNWSTQTTVHSTETLYNSPLILWRPSGWSKASVLFPLAGKPHRDTLQHPPWPTSGLCSSLNENEWVWDHAELVFFFSFSILLLYLFLYFFDLQLFFISTIGEWIREKLLERLIKGAGQTARHICCLCVWGRRCRGEESEWQWSNWPIRKAVCHGVCRSQPEPPPVAPTPALLEPFLQSAWMVCLSMCGDGLNAFGKHTCHIFIYIPKGWA